MKTSERKKRYEPNKVLRNNYIRIGFTDDQINAIKSANTENYTLSSFLCLLVMEGIDRIVNKK